MAHVESGSATPTADNQGNSGMEPSGDSNTQNGGEKAGENGEHSTPGTYFAGGSHLKRPPPAKVFFAPQKYGFFTNNKVEQRWRDDPDKDKKTHADDIIANVTEKFFPQKRAAQDHMPPPVPPIGPAFMPPPPGVLPPPGMPGVPPPPFMMAPPISGKEAKRIKFNDEESDENELFAKLLYKKLRSITSRKRLEILHVSIMEMVRQAQEEDERERTATGMDSKGPQML